MRVVDRTGVGECVYKQDVYALALLRFHAGEPGPEIFL